MNAIDVPIALPKVSAMPVYLAFDSIVAPEPRGIDMMSLLDRLRMPVRLKRFHREFKDKPFTMLDVGCGYGSPSTTVSYFPKCSYSGIDRDAAGNGEEDFRVMESYYRLDLGRDDLDAIPDAHFDVVLFSHVIEHLTNGLEAPAALSRKVKPGGYIYVETPSLRSFAVPRSRRHHSHFCDDTTHVRFFELASMIDVLLDERFRIPRARIRRDPVRVAAAPFLILSRTLKGDSWSDGLWDVLGTAQYVYAVRRDAASVRAVPRPEAAEAADRAI
jgi:SAM-dependent methyltransferase